jgi:hypothetical protein
MINLCFFYAIILSGNLFYKNQYECRLASSFMRYSIPLFRGVSAGRGVFLLAVWKLMREINHLLIADYKITSMIGTKNP